jgi:hypothetical protein
MDCWNAGKRNFVLLRAHKHADAPYPLGLLRARCERPHSRAAKGDNTFSPSNMDCHATLPRGHATEETMTHPVVLRCGISTRLMSLVGQKPRPSQPRHVSFRRLRTLVRANIRWSSRPTLLKQPVRRRQTLAGALGCVVA